MGNVPDIILNIGLILAGPYLWLFQGKMLAGLVEKSHEALVHGGLVAAMIFGAYGLNNIFSGED